MRLYFDYEGEAKRLRELAEEATTPGLREALRRRARHYQAVADGLLPPDPIKGAPERTGSARR